MTRGIEAGVFVLALAACGGGVDEMDAGRGDAGLDPGPDAGKADGGALDAGSDAGPIELSCEAGRVRILDECPAFAPCGGEIVGEWCYADVCITKNELLARVLEQPGVPDACTANAIVLLSSTGTIEGTVSITDATIGRTIETTATGTFRLPDDCLIGTCRGTEAAIDGALDTMGSATCEDLDTGCECDITFLSGVDMVSAYVAAGDVIETDTGREFEYCVEDRQLRFRETSAGGEPGVQTALPSAGP